MKRGTKIFLGLVAIVIIIIVISSVNSDSDPNIVGHWKGEIFPDGSGYFRFTFHDNGYGTFQIMSTDSYIALYTVTLEWTDTQDILEDGSKVYYIKFIGKGGDGTVYCDRHNHLMFGETEFKLDYR